jgi:hypothetical protein
LDENVYFSVLVIGLAPEYPPLMRPTEESECPAAEYLALVRDEPDDHEFDVLLYFCVVARPEDGAPDLYPHACTENST